MLEYKISTHDSKSNTYPIKILSMDVSSDMSILSGVTLATEHLDILDNVYVTNGNNMPPILCPLSTENHTRYGVIMVNNAKFPIKKANSLDHPIVGDREVEWEYIEFQNSYYYIYTNEDDEKMVDIPFIVDEEGVIETGYTSFAVEDDNVTISYGVFIDDWKVNINGLQYIVDWQYKDNDGNTFALKLSENGDPLFASDLDVDSLDLNIFEICKRYDVTYFTITTDVEQEWSFTRITCANSVILYHYNEVLRRCTNLQTDDEPLWGIRNINLDENNPVSALCYTYDEETHEEIVVSGDTFKNCKSDDLCEMRNEFWTYLPNDVTHTKFPLQIELQNSNEGYFLMVYVPDGNMLGVNSILRFKDNENTITLDIVRGEEVADDYVLYNGRPYYRKLNLCDQVKINDEYFDITYEDVEKIGDTKAYVNIYGVNVEMHSIGKDTLEKRTNQIVSGDTLVYPQYEVIHRDGVVIDGHNCPIIDIDSDDFNQESGVTRESYALLERHHEHDFVVESTYGSNIMVIRPILKTIGFDWYETHQIYRSICNEVFSNTNTYTMYFLNHLFAKQEYETGLGFIDDKTPSSTRDFYGLESKITIYGIGTFLHLDIPLKIKPANNILLDNIQYSQFYETNRKKLINSIVDMEKDVYYPMYPQIKNGEYVFSNGFPEMLPVYEIQTNLHFRTRNRDNWKVIESYQDEEMCNWFVVDYPFYKDNFKGREDELIESSDLLGFLNFDWKDVFYQKKKLEKSFLRFSVYDSPDQQTQTLLHTSTVWFDETYAYKKYISNTKRFDNLIFSGVGLTETEQLSSHSITELNEPYFEESYTLKDENRLSSRFTIHNKYETSASAEGFYLYIFKKYTHDLTPVPLYMKVEFNHAGIGQKFPFIVPMKWETDDNGNCYPTEKLTLKEDDLEKLKQGYALEDIYMQTYIPLYCAYDKLKRQFFYYFDERYVTNDNGVIKLNLFEIKVADSDITGYNTNKKFILSDGAVISNLIGNIQN